MFKPLRDIVLISKKAPERVTQGGIVLPGAPVETVTRAIVEAVGPGYVAQQTGEFVPTSVQPGDLVIVPPDCGRRVALPGYGDKELFIITEAEIAGVITE